MTVNVSRADLSGTYKEASINASKVLVALYSWLRTSGERERSLCCISVIGASKPGASSERA